MRSRVSSIYDFIGGNRKVFLIPPFQRNYSWGNEQCEELFEDIIYAYKRQKNHYLGNVTFYYGLSSPSYNEFVLVDGQQRITSLLLLLCALRDHSNDRNLIDDINQDYLMNPIRNNVCPTKIKQTSFDYNDFCDIINSNISNVNKNNRIYMCYNCFRGLIINILNNSSINDRDLFDAIGSVEIVEVNLDIINDLESVQSVFEKINSTGIPLQQSDLIRNFLLLTNNSQTQLNYYNNYWVHIENNVGVDNVFSFVKDYFIMKTIPSKVNDKEIYSEFKNYVNINGLKHSDVLDDLKKYSTFYAWLYKGSGNAQLDEIIEKLNYLKSSDLYPLYIYILEKKQKNCIDIFNLLCDFMIRFRIVCPSSGGTALKSVVSNLLSKLTDPYNPISLDESSIRTELSNSKTSESRYPTDAEFKDELKKSNKTNYTYGRIVLEKIERSINKFNVPVAFKDITVEHLMPQTLSNSWKTYLGSNSQDIYDNYINSIGNLAPLSKGYNSKISNADWNIKIQNLTNVQFNITSSIAQNYSNWTEIEIKDRNDKLADLAVKCISGPVPRSKPIQSGNVYLLSNANNMTGLQPDILRYNGTDIYISSWVELMTNICEIVYNLNQNKFISLVQSNKIHKKSSKINKNQYDPILSFNNKDLQKGKMISDSNIYVETCMSADSHIKYANAILNEFGIINDFEIIVK